MPEPHDHQWQDTGFAAVEDCAVPGCEAVRSEPNDKPEREWSYMDRQTGLTGDDVDEQGRLTYTTESASDASPGPTSALSVLDAVAHVEALAQTLYDDAMGRDWPMPYSSLTASDQERWRGAAYCATYALAICPITRSVHPWLRSWCEPSCRTAASAQAEASTDERTGDQVNDVVEETGVNLGKEYGWECADCDTVSGLRWDTQHMAEGSLAIHRVNEHATCDHCHQTLTRSPWKEGGYWKGKDHTSDCPGNPRGHAVKGKTR